MSNITDVLVIGGGVAGMTAALYALRSGKTVKVIEQETFGGQIANSPRVENFPSQKSIAGTELADKLMEQIMALGAGIELEKVEAIAKNEDGTFTVTTDYGTHLAKSVVAATGVKHKHLGLPMEEELVGKGVSYCAVCDGPFYKGEEVALIGDGNSALQYAILLSGYCKKVYVCILFDHFFGDKALVDELLTKPNVEIIKDVCTEALLYESDLTGIRLRGMKDKTYTRDLRVAAAFVAIGQYPDNHVFENLADLDSQGYFIADETCATKTEGLYVAGDCRTKKIRQLTTAVADGAVAGLAAVAYSK